jgi:hypothetical protein
MADRSPVKTEEKVLRKKRCEGIGCSEAKIEGEDWNRHA